jgi:hypothetical protein
MPTDPDHVCDPRETEWFQLGALALHAALNEDWTGAGQAINALGELDRGRGLVNAMTTWIDTVGHAYGITYGPDAPLVGFVDVDTSVPTFEMDGSKVADPVDWTGKLVQARFRMDEETFMTLLHTVPDDDTYQAYVSQLLHSASLMLKAAAAGKGPVVCDG